MASKKKRVVWVWAALDDFISEKKLEKLLKKTCPEDPVEILLAKIKARSSAGYRVVLYMYVLPKHVKSILKSGLIVEEISGTDDNDCRYLEGGKMYDIGRRLVQE